MAASELPIPPSAASDIGAKEILRVWVAGGRQHVSLATGEWKDPAAWGIMLVDLARHLANAHAQTRQSNPAEVMARIREGFDAEWEHPTDKPTGGILA